MKIISEETIVNKIDFGYLAILKAAKLSKKAHYLAGHAQKKPRDIDTIVES